MKNADTKIIPLKAHVQLKAHPSIVLYFRAAFITDFSKTASPQCLTENFMKG